MSGEIFISIHSKMRAL